MAATFLLAEAARVTWGAATGAMVAPLGPTVTVTVTVEAEGQAVAALQVSRSADLRRTLSLLRVRDEVLTWHQRVQRRKRW